MIRNLLLAALVASFFSLPSFAADRVHFVAVESITVAGADTDVSNMTNLIGHYSETTKTNQGLGFAKIRQTVNPGNRDRIMQAIDELRGKVGRNDVVLFYYSGHGAIDNQGPFLQLDDEGRIHRAELMQKLRGVGGRLHLLITDCCAVEVPPKKNVRMGAAFIRPNAEKTQRLVDNLNRLFRATGAIDLNSASPKQVAWGTSGGGLFTKSLVNLLFDSNVADWQALHRNVTAKTEEEYTQFRTEGLSDNGQRLNLADDDLNQLRNQNRQTPHFFQFALAGADKARPQGNPNNTDTAGGPRPRPQPKPPVVDTTPPNLPPLIGGSDDTPMPPVRPPMATKGVVVLRVFPETSAAGLNLQGEVVQLDKGDRILEVNGVFIESPKQFHTIIDQMEKGATFLLKVVDRRSGKVVEVGGKLDLGGGFRFGALIEEK